MGAFSRSRRRRTGVKKSTHFVEKPLVQHPKTASRSMAPPRRKPVDVRRVRSAKRRIIGPDNTGNGKRRQPTRVAANRPVELRTNGQKVQRSGRCLLFYRCRIPRDLLGSAFFIEGLARDFLNPDIDNEPAKRIKFSCTC